MNSRSVFRRVYLRQNRDFGNMLNGHELGVSISCECTDCSRAALTGAKASTCRSCPNQHEVMLLLTQIVSTTMHGDSKLYAAVSQPSLGQMGPNSED